MSESQDMAPEASPNGGTAKAGVRRVNNMPMFILMGVIGSFVLVMALVASDRSAKQNAKLPAAKEEGGGDSGMFAREIAGDQTSGIIAPAKAPTVPTLPGVPAAPTTATGAGDEVLIAVPENLDEPPSPYGPSHVGGAGVAGNGANGQPMERTPEQDEADRIRQAKLQAFEEAVRASPKVQASGARRERSAPTPTAFAGQSRGGASDARAMLAELRAKLEGVGADDPTAAYQAQLAAVQASLPAGGGGGFAGGATPEELAATYSGGPNDPPNRGGSSRPTPTGNYRQARNNYAQFDGEDAADDRWYLGQKVQAPRTKYELRAGGVIPATMLSGINSDLPGQITAQVSQSVYDTATGKYELIPQGARLVGTYSADVAYGQERVLVAWTRIVFPDGKALDIGAMPGADGAGYSGFKDQVNNHYLRIFGSAILMSGVVAGITISQDSGQTSIDGRKSASDVLSESLGQQLGMVTAQMISKNMNIAPTLEIRPGYRFNVVAVKDLTFNVPYRSFDY